MEIDIKSIGATAIRIGMDARIARLHDLGHALEHASDMFYAEVRTWYDSNGDGTWAPLADSTVASKTSQGAGDPARPLYLEGNLYESATSPSGPWSYRIVEHDKVVMGIDWDEGGYQIPMILSHGAGEGGMFPSGAHGPNWSIPARPIWPNVAHLARVRDEIGHLILHGG